MWLFWSRAMVLGDAEMASWTCCLELLGCSSALFWSSVWSWAWRSLVNCRVISSMLLYSLLSWVFFFLAMKWMILMQSLPKHLYPCLALSSVLASSPVQVAGLPMDAWTICQASSKMVSACMALLKGEPILGRSPLDSNLAYPFHALACGEHCCPYGSSQHGEYACGVVEVVVC